MESPRSPTGPQRGDAAEDRVPAADEPALDVFDRAMRHLALACAKVGRPAPGAFAALLDNKQVTLYLAEPDTPPPATPWVSSPHGRQWHAPRKVLETLTVRPGAPSSHSGFVTVGSLGTSPVLVDLSRAPGSISIDGDPSLAHAIATAFAEELTTSPWSRDVLVTIVTPSQTGQGRASQGGAGPANGDPGRNGGVDLLDSVTRVDSIAEVIARLEPGVPQAGNEQHGHAPPVRPAPVRPAGRDTDAVPRPLEVVVCLRDTDPDLEHLAVLARDASHVCLIVASAFGAAAWRFVVRPDAVLDTGLGFTVDVSPMVRGRQGPRLRYEAQPPRPPRYMLVDPSLRTTAHAGPGGGVAESPLVPGYVRPPEERSEPKR